MSAIRRAQLPKPTSLASRWSALSIPTIRPTGWTTSFQETTTPAARCACTRVGLPTRSSTGAARPSRKSSATNSWKSTARKNRLRPERRSRRKKGAHAPFFATGSLMGILYGRGQSGKVHGSKEQTRMADITAGMVKELRERTGLGMMECKRALEEAGGDMKKAEDLLRIKSGAKAGKMAGRVAAEGAIGVYVSADGKLGALVEVNCETDFVAKDANFAGFVKSVAEIVALKGITDVDPLARTELSPGQTVEESRP